MRSFRLGYALVLVVVGGALASTPAQASSFPAYFEAAFSEAGVDQSSIVHQDGPLNYAGPNCPGAGWNCAPAGVPVFQATAGGLNVVECFDVSGCVAGQDAHSAGANSAICRDTATETPSDQQCVIVQRSAGTNNVATVELRALQAEGNTQSADQDAFVRQVNAGDGGNTVTVAQSTDQTSTVARRPRSSVQTQEANLALDLRQESAGGDNDALVGQSEAQTARAEVNGVGDVTQRQNASLAGPDVFGKVRQLSQSGDNSLSFGQQTRQEASGVALSGTVGQVQGSVEGGLKGDIDQSSDDGFSSYTVDQDETQIVNGDTTPAGVVQQAQHGPVLCCISFSSTTPNRATIDQTTIQNSNRPGVTRTNTIRATCEAKEADGCTTTSTLVQDGQVVAQTDCTSSSCDESIDCSAGETCQTATREPSHELHKAVINISDEEAYGGDEAPSATIADPSEVIEYRLTYHNHGDGSAAHVTLTDTIPPHSTFRSCDPVCILTGSVPGETVSWSLGGVEAGGTRVVSYRTTLDESFESTTTITNEATAHEAGVPVDRSNMTTVTVTENPDAPSESCTPLFAPSEVGGARVSFDEEGRADGEVLTTQYSEDGVTFEPVGTMHATIYGNSDRVTSSPPHSARMEVLGDGPTTSAPMVMRFEPDVARVGMFVGNGATEATLSLYRADGSFICSRTRTEISTDVVTFIGIGVGAATVDKAVLDYGAEAPAVEIDDLRYSTSTSPPVLVD